MFEGLRGVGGSTTPCNLDPNGSTFNLDSTKETPEQASLEWSVLGSFWTDKGLLGSWGQAWDSWVG